MTTDELTREQEIPASAPERRPRYPVTFWFVGAVLCVFLMASTVPSPMYAIYQQRWGFSATVLTEVFAIYALAILISLLLIGSLSDHIGRRPVLIGSIVLEIAALAVLAAAPDVGWLYLGRALQGVATGAATSAISGALLDLQPPGTATGAIVNGVAAAWGLALGALLAGVLVQLAPAPTVLSYVVLLGLLVGAFAGSIAMPESARLARLTPHDGTRRAVFRPQRPHVPAGRRGAFALLATTMLASWAVCGMYMALGPSVIQGMVEACPYLVGGCTITALTGVGGLAQLLLSHWTEHRAVRAGSVLLVVGLAMFAWSLVSHGVVVFFTGSVVLGVGWGLMFMGGFRMLTALADADHRAATASMIYIVAYLSAGVPTVTLGFLTTNLGLTTAAAVLSAAAAVFAVMAGLSTFTAQTRTTT